MTIGKRSIEVLLSDPHTSVKMPFLHEVGIEFRNRTRQNNSAPGCKKCRKEPYTEDLVYRAVSILSSLSGSDKQRAIVEFGDSEVIWNDAKNKQHKRIL